MSRATNELIVRAEALEDESLNDAVSALKVLGEEANGNDETFKILLEMVTKLEADKAEKLTQDNKDEMKDIRMSGVKKFAKLQKNPFAVGLNVYHDKEFELDLTLLAKQNKKLIPQIKRAIELKMIRVI